MSMDIDPSPSSALPAANPPPSPEKKRKHKENDEKSSKRRKHQEAAHTTIDLTGDSPVKGVKQKKPKKDHERSQARETPDPSSQLQQELQQDHEPRSQKKHKKHRDVDDNATPPSAQQPPRSERAERRPSFQSRSPSVRKPLSNATAVQSSPSSSTTSPFQLITSTLYLPLSPISISPTHALSSLLVEHVSPLLLTYYPPLKGIILAYSNPSISSTPPSPESTSPKPQDSNPQPLTMAVTANEYGVLYVYLTATFLVFRPERSQTLEGWINVQSEGFLGAVVFNLFSVGIDRRRLPAGWKWVPPGQDANGDEMDVSSESGYPTTANTTEAEEESDSDKENYFKPLPSSASVNFADPAATMAEEEEDGGSGYFQTPSGKRVRGVIRFRVRDVDVIPGSERDKGFLSIEGTMLSEEEEAKLVEDEKRRVSGSGSKSSRKHEQRQTATESMTMSGGVAPKGAIVIDDADEGASGPAREKTVVKRKKGAVPAA